MPAIRAQHTAPPHTPTWQMLESSSENPFRDSSLAPLPHEFMLHTAPAIHTPVLFEQRTVQYGGRSRRGSSKIPYGTANKLVLQSPFNYVPSPTRASRQHNETQYSVPANLKRATPSSSDITSSFNACARKALTSRQHGQPLTPSPMVPPTGGQTGVGASPDFPQIVAQRSNPPSVTYVGSNYPTPIINHPRSPSVQLIENPVHTLQLQVPEPQDDLDAAIQGRNLELEVVQVADMGEFNDPVPEHFSDFLPFFMLAEEEEIPVRVHAEKLDVQFFRAARIRRFNAATPPPSALGSLFDLMSHRATGITIRQFAKIFLRCVTCARYLHIDRLNGHNCDTPLLAVTLENDHAADMMIINSLLSNNSPGLTRAQLIEFLVVCPACEHVFFCDHQDAHPCVY
ncbi:hypothetical protein FA15DRAFT_653438 [Coprinopsis marcescibilis]|uniref:Uncharacterized protein n=1 Tax=Coprinopsis marcescibilis TaxID=230819 RepID=A0A5C3L3F5_COPMA|nr:hypothetical protein FA15DRAFT_653438 [Coprinopsis marcescibilis]